MDANYLKYSPLAIGVTKADIAALKEAKAEEEMFMKTRKLYRKEISRGYVITTSLEKYEDIK